jgi:prepilin-type N-terminal cleavage/methylation domain-containing protein
MSLTPLEQEALVTLDIVRDMFAAGASPLKRDYLWVMTQVRDCISHLVNKQFGCSTGKHADRCHCPKEGGFTLVELMMVVALIVVLAGIVVPKVSTAIGQANDAATRGNLGALRSALSIYYSDTEGVYPSFSPPYSTPAGYGPLLQETLVPKYMAAIPKARPYNGRHAPSSQVCLVWNQTGDEEDPEFSVGQGWKYDANPFDIGLHPGVPGWGSIMVLCTHRNLRGRNWFDE